MRVIIDGRMYHTAPIGGGFAYLNEIIPRISRSDGIQLSVLLPRNTTAVPANAQELQIKKEILPVGGWFPQGKLRRGLGVLRRWGEAKLWQMRLLRLKDTVYHSANYGLPPVKRVTTVFTIHDMITEVFKETLRTPSHEELRRIKSECFRRGTHFIAISDQTKKDMVRLADIDPKKISTIHHGVNEAFFSRPHFEEEETAIRGKFSLREPYVLYVGGRLHHKNFLRCATAFASSRQGLKDSFTLVVAGGAWNTEERAHLARLGISNRVQLAYLPNDEELRLLYRLANLFVYPSLYEGFGLPLLEAMAAGTPVAAARTSCLPEVAGDAALYFDPEDPEEMAKVMEQLTDLPTSQHFRKAGCERARLFSWDATAIKTVEAYARALRQKA